MSFERTLNNYNFSFFKKIMNYVDKECKEDITFYNRLFLSTKDGLRIECNFEDCSISIEKEGVKQSPKIVLKNDELHYNCGTVYVSDSFFLKVLETKDYNERDLYKKYYKKQKKMNDKTKDQIISFLNYVDQELDTIKYDKNESHDFYNFREDVWKIYDNYMTYKELLKLNDEHPYYDSLIEAANWWSSYLLTSDENANDKIYATEEEIENFKKAFIKLLKIEVEDQVVNVAIIRTKPDISWALKEALIEACIDVTRRELIATDIKNVTTYVHAYNVMNFYDDKTIYEFDATTEEDINEVKKKYLEQTRPTSKRRGL